MSVFPLFAFKRHHEVDLIFAGTLVVEFPRDREPAPHQRKQIMEIVDDLIAKAQSGQLSNDACLYGWPSEGGRPANAVDVDDDVLMSDWIQRSLVIGVQVGPGGQRFLWLDSDTLRQMRPAHKAPVGPKSSQH